MLCMRVIVTTLTHFSLQYCSSFKVEHDFQYMCMLFKHYIETEAEKAVMYVSQKEKEIRLLKKF